MSIAKLGSKSLKIFSVAVLIYTCILCTIIAAAVSVTDQEETSVVRANTTSEDILQAKVRSPQEDRVSMPEITLEELAETIEEAQVPLAVFKESVMEVYTVQPGDTLWKIASKKYDDGALYPYIMNINDLESETIYVGQELKIGYDNSEYMKEYSDEYLTSSMTYTMNKTTPTEATPDKNGMTYVGKFFITGYNPWCSHCCGKSNGTTASGKEATVGQTIATSSQFPFGTKLYIEGYGIYTVEDRGVNSSTIDVAADSHEACYALTARNVNVYKVA